MADREITRSSDLTMAWSGSVGAAALRGIEEASPRATNPKTGHFEI
jgi:hypothetical protein